MTLEAGFEREKFLFHEPLRVFENRKVMLNRYPVGVFCINLYEIGFLATRVAAVTALLLISISVERSQMRPALRSYLYLAIIS